MKNPKKALGFIFITLLIDVIGFGIIIPVFPKLITGLVPGSDLSDASKYTGWLMFTFSAMQLLFAPILGNLSDKYGRRPVLLISLFGFGIDYLFLAFAPTLGWLFVGRLIAGITGASFTTASAYIADISTNENRAQNFGILGVAFGVGFIIGPVLGGLLGQYGARVPFIASAGLCLLNWLYGYFVLPESLSKENRREFNWKRANPFGSFKKIFYNKILTGLSVGLFLLFLAFHSVQSTWSFFTMERFGWNERQVGYSLGVVGVLVAIVQGGLIRVVIPKIGQVKSIYLGLWMTVIGLLLFSIANQGWMMYLCLIPYCLSGFAGPAMQGILTGQVSMNEQGELQGALTSIQSLTAIIGPLLMTNLFATFADKTVEPYFPGAPFLAGSILTIFSIYFVYRTLKRNRYSEPRPVIKTEPEMAEELV
jgi:DHA1 family tetracycline resistance protein-like MFS transporter